MYHYIFILLVLRGLSIRCCHFERRSDEESHLEMKEILHFVQDDRKSALWILYSYSAMPAQ